ncbi:putative reverse transcriptase zinc-binding domain-containing protein [Helianthus annuus]|uniref:Reverse transcriptase zinc-binding domain-containing protein n=1 Tax=Helianthus annuus TaxID=4232 RepID=A0A9K3EFW0_HELAN|nr:putative reverse transcriptase zinc-binding domain-containing protein [Helianthus annuus]
MTCLSGHDQKLGFHSFPSRQDIKPLKAFWNKHKVDGIGLNGVLRGNLGNGRQLRFWLDTWLGNQPLKAVYPSLYSLGKSKGVVIADRLKRIGTSRVLVWDWIRAPSSTVELSDKQRLEDQLHSVTLLDRDDTWIWSHDSDVVFQIASVKKWLRGPVSSNAEFGFKWSSWVPNKCNIFMWRAFLDRLPTKMALARRHINIDDLSCVWCEDAEENIEHVLTGCAIASGVWNSLASWCNIPRPFVFHVNDLVELHEHSRVTGIKKKVLQGIIIIACWRLWRARNDKVFDSKAPIVTELVADIKSLGFLWYKHRFKAGVVDWSRWCLFDVT